MIQNINLGGRIAKSQYPVHDAIERHRGAATASRRKCARRSRKLPGLLDVATDLYAHRTRRRRWRSIARGRRPMASPVDQMRQELFNAFGNRQVGTIYTAIDRLPDHSGEQAGIPHRSVEPGEDLRQDQRAGLERHGRRGQTGPGSGVAGNGTPSGQSIPLSAVTRLVPSVGPLLVNHQGQQPSVTISFNLAPGFALGQASGCDPAGRAGREPAGDPSPPASRAPRRCSRIR